MENLKINKIIIWGLKDSSSTHSHIHNAFFRAFKYLKYDTYWINKKNEYKGEIKDALILYSGLCDEEPPIKDSCFYLLHNVTLKTKNFTVFQVYTTDCIGRDKETELKYHYYNNDIIYFYWGTNLLPNEIENNIKNIYLINNDNNKNCHHVGTLSGDWKKPYDIFSNHLKSKYNIDFKSRENIKDTEMIKFIQDAHIVPALQFKWQVDKEYIPCRIFKNISYGKMGITNNSAVNNIFDNKLIYDKDLEKLADKCMVFYNKPKKLQIERIVELMKIVKKNHTYISKINLILDFLKKEKNIEIMKK